MYDLDNNQWQFIDRRQQLSLTSRQQGLEREHGRKRTRVGGKTGKREGASASGQGLRIPIHAEKRVVIGQVVPLLIRVVLRQTGRQESIGFSR